MVNNAITALMGLGLAVAGLSRAAKVEASKFDPSCYMIVQNQGGGQWGIACEGGCGEDCDDWLNPETRFVTCLCGGQTPQWTCQSFFNSGTEAVQCATVQCTGECQALPLPPQGDYGFVCGCDGH